MWLLMIEAGVALFLLVFIVWWTMYSGQKPTRDEQDTTPAPEKNDAPDR
jgi:cbb3-type cytochrome oxidase subunit 3